MNTCNSTCRTAYKAMRLSAYNGSCDLCASNTGNSSLASWSTNSTNCAACAQTWQNYSAACSGGANKACFNFDVIANGNLKSIANLLTQSTAVPSGAGDVYDFFSQYTNAIATCSDAFDYLAGYALTTNNDPLFPAGVTGSDCPVQGASNLTCSAACNNDWYLLADLCQTQTVIQYDNNGLPGPNGVSVAAPPDTFITIELALQYLLNGTAMGPYNNNTLTGSGDAPYVLTDASCVASNWFTTFTDGTTGIGLSTSSDASTPIPTTVLGINTTAMVAKPAPASTTCLQAAAIMNTSVAPGGSCDACLSDTGSAGGCFANCPLCASVFTTYIDACGATGDNTLQPTFALASYWAGQLQTVAGNFANGDCYLNMVEQIMMPLAAVCSDYVASLALSSLTIFQSNPNPNNSSLTINGPNCPTTASDSAYAPGTCPAACGADLALFGGCQRTSTVSIPLLNVNNVPFPTAWAQLVNGSMGVVNSAKTTNAAFNLTGCASILATYAPGVLANGAVNASLPTAAPNCSAARATLLASTNNGACDQCSSNTGNPTNCFTDAAGDPDCLQCGVQYDQYTNACNETYNDIGNIFAFNLQQTTAAGNLGDCFDYFNQAAQSLIGTAGFDTDNCTDTWDSIVQYSETLYNDPADDTAGPNCNVVAGSSCPASCQADLAQLNTFCTTTSIVQWAGFGYTAANGSTIVAPAGTNVTIATAWQLFVNGTATYPIGNTIVKGVATSVPFALAACTLPSWAPTTGPGSVAGMTATTVTGSFSINLGSTTIAQLYAANAANNTIETAIAASLGVPAMAVTINWKQLLAAAGRRLLATTTIPYTVTTTVSTAAALTTKVAAFNPSSITSSVAALPGLSAVTTAPAPAPASAAVTTKHAAAVAVALAVALGF